MGVAKFIYGGETKFDLTSDTIQADKLLKGYTAHDANGDPVVGSCEFDANTQDGTITESDLLINTVGYSKGVRVVGTMPNNGSVAGVISNKDVPYTIPYGFHDGGGNVNIDATEKEKLVPTNIREGVTILGVEGSMTGQEDVKAQAKTVTPTTAEQVVLPDTAEGYTHLSQVTVKAIPYVETVNASGGIVITIG